jgi:hypothetical protein
VKRKSSGFAPLKLGFGGHGHGYGRGDENDMPGTGKGDKDKGNRPASVLPQAQHRGRLVPARRLNVLWRMARWVSLVVWGIQLLWVKV